MKRTLSFLLLLLLACVALSSAAEPPGFAGSWEAQTSATSSFSLDLTQTGNNLTGVHNAVIRNGNRVDAVLPGENAPSITGVVDGKTAHVQFRSGYGDGKGEALLTLAKNGTLKWKITQSAGSHYLPDAATLHRHVDPPASLPKRSSPRRTTQGRH